MSDTTTDSDIPMEDNPSQSSSGQSTSSAGGSDGAGTGKRKDPPEPHRSQDKRARTDLHDDEDFMIALGDPKPGDPHFIPKGGVPERAAGVQRALQQHIRILLGILSASSVIPYVSEAQTLAFKNSCQIEATAADLKARILRQDSDTSLTAQATKLFDSLRTSVKVSGLNAAAVRHIDDEFIHHTFIMVARAGLSRWLPDVRSPANTLYNIAHEHVAIESYKHILISLGYVTFGADPAYASKTAFLSLLYRSFVFSYLGGQARQEAANPGSIHRGIEFRNAYRRRAGLKDARQEWAENQAFPDRVLRLFGESECHSDDELIDDVRKVYRVRTKEYRDQQVTELFDLATEGYGEMRIRANGSVRGILMRERQRDPSAVSTMGRFPRDVPMDWFKPDEFNGFTAQDRAHYAKNGIALPLPEHCKSWDDVCKWKNLPLDTFMKDYGDAKKALYNVPTDEEIAQLEINRKVQKERLADSKKSRSRTNKAKKSAKAKGKGKATAA